MAHPLPYQSDHQKEVRATRGFPSEPHSRLLSLGSQLEQAVTPATFRRLGVAVELSPLQSWSITGSRARAASDAVFEKCDAISANRGASGARNPGRYVPGTETWARSCSATSPYELSRGPVGAPMAKGSTWSGLREANRNQLRLCKGLRRYHLWDRLWHGQCSDLSVRWPRISSSKASFSRVLYYPITMATFL